MTRIEQIREAADRLAETKNNPTARAQCRYDFELAAEWADETMINKACEWLMHNAFQFIDVDDVDAALKNGFSITYWTTKLIDEFRKAMKEGEQ